VKFADNGDTSAVEPDVAVTCTPPYTVDAVKLLTVMVVRPADVLGEPDSVAVDSVPPELAILAVYVGLDRLVGVGNTTVALSPLIAVTVGGVTWNGE